MFSSLFASPPPRPAPAHLQPAHPAAAVALNHRARSATPAPPSRGSLQQPARPREGLRLTPDGSRLRLSSAWHPPNRATCHSLQAMFSIHHKSPPSQLRWSSSTDDGGDEVVEILLWQCVCVTFTHSCCKMSEPLPRPNYTFCVTISPNSGGCQMVPGVPLFTAWRHKTAVSHHCTVALPHQRA